MGINFTNISKTMRKEVEGQGLHYNTVCSRECRDYHWKTLAHQDKRNSLDSMCENEHRLERKAL